MNSQLPSGLSTRGVVDLSSLAGSSGTAGPEGEGSGVATALTQANVQQAVIQRSAQVPVVLVVWSSADLSSSGLVKTLNALAANAQGAWELATLDVHTQPQLGAAFGVQAVPVTLAVVGGQMVPLFQGAVGEASIKQYLAQVVQLAATQGVGGAGQPGQPEQRDQPGQPAAGALGVDEEIEQAMSALEQGDFDGAQKIYQQRLARQPGDDFARIGLEQVELVRRVSALNPAQVMQAAISAPQDLDLALDAADVELTQGQVEQAFARLLGFVVVTSGADRDRVRQRLITYFDLLGPDDPRVSAARQRLTAALF